MLGKAAKPGCPDIRPQTEIKRAGLGDFRGIDSPDDQMYSHKLK